MLDQTLTIVEHEQSPIRQLCWVSDSERAWCNAIAMPCDTIHEIKDVDDEVPLLGGARIQSQAPAIKGAVVLWVQKQTKRNIKVVSRIVSEDLTVVFWSALRQDVGCYSVAVAGHETKAVSSSEFVSKGVLREE